VILEGLVTAFAARQQLFVDVRFAGLRISTPLSLVNITMVLSAMPRSSDFAIRLHHRISVETALES
jgi:hypothetical protein